MSSQRYDSDSEGDDFNPAPEVASDDEREPNRNRIDDEPDSPVQSRRDEPRRSSASRDDDDDEGGDAEDDEDGAGGRPAARHDDDDDDEEEDEEDDEDDMPVCGHLGKAPE